MKSAKAYKIERTRRGTQVAVAAALDIDRGTLIRREQGQVPIPREAWLAMQMLPVECTKLATRAARPA